MAGDDDADRPLTAADLKPLADGLDALRQRFEDLDDADTPAQRREAQGDLDDAEEDLEAMAKRLGIPRKTLNESIAAARRAERKEELRPVLAELLEELKAAGDPKPPAGGDDDDDDDADGDDTDDDADPPKAKPKPRRQPEVDSQPPAEHWMERGIGSLLR